MPLFFHKQMDRGPIHNEALTSSTLHQPDLNLTLGTQPLGYAKLNPLGTS